jgi:hypothetical protein
MAAAISLTSVMVAPMRPMAATAVSVDVWMAVIWPVMSSVTLAVWVTSAFTSEATPPPQGRRHWRRRVRLAWLLNGGHSFTDKVRSNRWRQHLTGDTLSAATRLIAGKRITTANPIP